MVAGKHHGGGFAKAQAIETTLRRPSRRVSGLERELTALRLALLPVARELYELPLFRSGPSRERDLPLATLVARSVPETTGCDRV